MFDKLKGTQRSSVDDGRYSDSGTRPPSYVEAEHSRPQYSDEEDQQRYSSQNESLSNAECSASLPTPSTFASVSLHMSDRLRFLQLPRPVIAQIRSRISHPEIWPRGIQEERQYHGSWEIKLRGNPWHPTGNDAIYARRLTREVIATLYSLGWILYSSTDISRKTNDKDNLFFRFQPRPPPTVPVEWFSLTFSRGDRLRLIDCPAELRQAIVAALAYKTQSHGPYRIPGVYELKFTGHPFMALGGESMDARLLVLKLLDVLQRGGWRVYASIDQKYGGENANETDTWQICQN
ncbi:hypothetical protein LTR62_001210 [Meristemomyces frigidus]|uniref:Uncharacterized protein n=1 Tax=Meristemomyces frigidus TaxID=1508187 RepID=A0AAN7TNV8_9PEZI|nr:hypothetical protein LTR62_001210 [Meristemomyces frigidus]